MPRPAPAGGDRSLELTGFPRPLRSPPRLTICRCCGEIDAPIGEVAFDHRGIALGRRAIAARTRSDDFDRFSGAQAVSSVDEWLDTVAEPEGSASAGMTAGETPRRRQQPRAVEPQVAFRLGAVHPA